MSRPLIEKWNPYLTFTCTRKEIKAWLLANGDLAFYDGKAWELRSKHLGAGVHKVWFVEKE